MGYASRRTKTQPVDPSDEADEALPEIHESSIKVVSLRVPDTLHFQAKLCADAYGIPVNALVCIALGEFLTEKGYRVHPDAPVKRG